MAEHVDYKSVIDKIRVRLVNFLTACDSIVPWFGNVKHILNMLLLCSEKLEAIRTNNNYTSTNYEELNYYVELIELFKLNIIFDIAFKLSVTQCTYPVYGCVLETILDNVTQMNFTPESFQELVDLKMLAHEYGFAEDSLCDGTQEATEDFLKYLQSVENKLTAMEKYAVNNADEQIQLVSILELKKIVAKIFIIRPNKIFKDLRDNVIMETDYLIIRLINLANCINFKTDYNSCIIYMIQYRLLAKKKFERSRLFETYLSHVFSQISSHLLHQKTRVWLMGKIETWLVTSKKPIYYLIGSEGTGKSCLVSAFCKLYDNYIFNIFVYDSRYPSGTTELIKSIANSLMHNLPEYLNQMDKMIPENQPASCSHQAHWKELYQFLLKKPLTAIAGQTHFKNCSRKLIVIDALNEAKKSEWHDLIAFMDMFRKDFGDFLCFLVTCRKECVEMTSYFFEQSSELHSNAEGIDLDSKTWIGLHLTDLEMFFVSCLCDVISRRITVQELASGENFRGFSKSIDCLLKHTAGKFSYAQHILRLFDESMLELQGQFQKSILNTLEKFSLQIGREKMDDGLKTFSKVFYTYRLKEGNPVHPPPELYLLITGKSIRLESVK
ncbi:hypothetical protein HELRODRAFT_161048 [Helobdella robusta]|uniref:Nephrocystin 3-like N-terminal domain-containing protein n=1 Tax=Helobdella robusta TaxID=6412 RepID=T1ER21_HELRO|nr:hypothetical protein HELRODRAFT_161048 [Helobdella robusta]ESO01870.1 hypothetical protein HELRODRAFT_161048 [Helobdella robusta]